MSTRAWVGAETETGIKAVYVHCDGDSMGEQIKELVAQHGLSKVVSTLLQKSDPWEAFADWTPRPEHNWYFTDQYDIVPGFGVRINPETPWHYRTPKDLIPWDIEWVWIIESDGTLKWSHKGVTKGDRTWRTQDWQRTTL